MGHEGNDLTEKLIEWGGDWSSKGAQWAKATQGILPGTLRLRHGRAPGLRSARSVRVGAKRACMAGFALNYSR